MKHATVTIFIISMGSHVQGFIHPTPFYGKITRICPLYAERTGRSVIKSDTEWKEILTPEQFDVLREEGTEPSNTSPLNTIDVDGCFKCAGCDEPLFETTAKFESGTGWPSFYAPIDSEALELSMDLKMGLPRTECRCSACGGHLGHVFSDGPNPTGQRFCINGVAMKFLSSDENPELAEVVSERKNSSPYKVGVGDVLPGILSNGLVGLLFANSFLTNVKTGIQSPFDVLPLLVALYFIFTVAQDVTRLIK